MCIGLANNSDKTHSNLITQKKIEDNNTVYVTVSNRSCKQLIYYLNMSKTCECNGIKQCAARIQSTFTASKHIGASTRKCRFGRSRKEFVFFLVLKKSKMSV